MDRRALFTTVGLTVLVFAASAGFRGFVRTLGREGRGASSGRWLQR
jgi:hypothetical protein